MLHSTVIGAAWLAFLLAGGSAQAQVFPLDAGQDMVGRPGQTEAEQKDTLPDIARQYHLGFDEIIAANPGVDAWLPGVGRVVRLPTEHLLPNVPRSGIVVNLPDSRLYYFRSDAHGAPVVEIYPISMGQMDWKTPIGVTKIVQKEKSPTWFPPKSVRAKHLQDGEVLPPFIPPGLI
jgi:L,D-transpeptidase ErfK/SrfK